MGDDGGVIMTKIRMMGDDKGVVIYEDLGVSCKGLTKRNNCRRIQQEVSYEPRF